jgi:nucleoside phosphorylase
LLGAFENLPNSSNDEDVFASLINDCQKKLLEKAGDDEAKLKKWQQLYKFRVGSDSENMMQTGAMASSDFVGKSELFGKWLQTHNRKYVAVEMEGGGVASALHSKDKHLRLLILRGITDVADATKNDMEPEAREAFRYCGIYNVMRFLVALIDSHLSRKFSLYHMIKKIRAFFYE